MADVLHDLALRCGTGVKKLIAVHPKTAPKTLAILAEQPQLQVLVADHPNTPTEILEKWAKPSKASTFSLLFAEPWAINMQQEAKLVLAQHASANLLKRLPKNSQVPLSGSNCPKCSTQIPRESAFCLKCGTKIETKPWNQPCKSCGAAIPLDAAYCLKCGNPVSQSLPPPPVIPPETKNQDSLPIIEQAFDPANVPGIPASEPIPKEIVQTLLIIALQQPIHLLVLASRRGTGIFEHVKLLETRHLIRAEKKGEETYLVTTEEFAAKFGLSHDMKEMQAQLRGGLDRINQKIQQETEAKRGLAVGTSQAGGQATPTKPAVGPSLKYSSSLSPVPRSRPVSNKRNYAAFGLLLLILIPALIIIGLTYKPQIEDSPGDTYTPPPQTSYVNITANNSILWHGTTHTGSYTDTFAKDNVNETLSGETSYIDALFYFFWWKPEYHRVHCVYYYGNMIFSFGYSYPETTIGFIEGSSFGGSPIYFSQQPDKGWKSCPDFNPLVYGSSYNSNFSIMFELAYPIEKIETDMIIVKIELESS